MKKILLIMLCSTLLFSSAQAQLTLLSSYNLATDTVVNAATSYLGIRNPGGKPTTTVQVVVTKISGTVGGVISLLGSLDGVNYKAATITEASTALHTFTALDVASQVFIWRLQDNPYLYYRVSYTGVTGPMSAKFTAKILSH